MYMLDTNVMSELRKLRRADPNVSLWAGSVESDSLYLSAMTIFEIEIGILRVARSNAAHAAIYHEWLHQNVLPSFVGRILPMDEHVALLFARMMTPKTRPYRDALIAATAQHHGYAVVTRNVRDFSDLPVRVINPWDFA